MFKSKHIPSIPECILHLPWSSHVCVRGRVWGLEGLQEDMCVKGHLHTSSRNDLCVTLSEFFHHKVSESYDFTELFFCFKVTTSVRGEWWVRSLTGGTSSGPWRTLFSFHAYTDLIMTHQLASRSGCVICSVTDHLFCSDSTLVDF